MRSFRRLALTLALFGLPAALVVSTAVVAHADSGAATTFVQGKHKTVVKLLNAPAGSDRDKKVDTELEGLIDYDEMAKSTLADEWGKRTPAEQKEFRDLLRELIQKNYKQRVNDTLTFAVDWKGEESKGSDVVVHTEASNPKDPRAPKVAIDYVLRAKGAGWQAVDIVIEGSSQVTTFKREFKKKIDKEGWTKLIETMKKKRDEKK